MTRHMRNTVELLSNGIILLTKVGDQDGRTLSSLYKQVSKIGEELRAQNKKVLLMSDCTIEGEIKLSAWKAGDIVGRALDFDKSATFGTPPVTRAKRQYIIGAEDVGQRVADFDTREEAEAWLLEDQDPPKANSKDNAEEASNGGITKPKFLPQTWAIFKAGNGRAMGEIVSANESITSDGWEYYITNPVGDNNYSVPEADITHILKGAQWVPTKSASEAIN